MMMTYLKLDAVAKRYGSVRALRDATFSVGAGEIVAVLGPNGAGKTTALEIALGLRAADAGTATLFGGSPKSLAMRRRLGATPQLSGFPDALRPREVARAVAAHYPDPADVDETLAAFGLAALANRRVGDLSGGEQRRLAVALAFVGAPDLVVLDEPTTGLDVESRRALWDRIRALSGGRRAVLFTTHYLEEAETSATRVVVIVDGAVRFDGTPASLRERFGVRRISYIGPDGPIDIATGDTDDYVRTLVHSGVAFRDLEIATTSLEDAFVALTESPR